ncbi:MAG TPA: Gfo/Idh/MocA family oxidoreductase [Roseiflexaceae bacterium]|nr:Gfo/Idh/MocA family oxidoreductase [Roseiflexaceae bacterium]
MTTDKLKVGIIGAGVGRAHAEGYAASPRVEIVGIAGLDDERVQALARRFNVPHTYREYADMLAVPEIDAVSIAVPNALHAPVTIAALEAGKHVLVEKPLARNATEGRAMVEAAKKAGKVLMVSFNHRQRNDVQWLRQYVESGALGKVYYAKAYWMRRKGIPGLGSWFVNKEQAGGGPLIDLGVHILDIAMFLLGEPTPVAVSANTYAEFGPRGLKGWETKRSTGQSVHYEVEDLATAFIRLESGATLLLEASWATHSSAGDDYGVVLYGTEGGAELTIKNYGHENTIRLFTDVNGVPFESMPFVPKGGGHSQVVERFIAAILDGAPAIPGAGEGLLRAEVIDACYRSAEAGREVRIEP